MGRPALAGRPSYADHGGVDPAAFLTEFEERNMPVPRLGGMARANGVVMVSECYWAFAGTDGSLREGRMPVAPRALRALPLARGLVRLSGSLLPLFKREGVTRGRERLFLIVAILAPLVLAFAPNWLGLTAGFVTTFALLGSAWSGSHQVPSAQITIRFISVQARPGFKRLVPQESVPRGASGAARLFSARAPADFNPEEAGPGKSRKNAQRPHPGFGISGG